MSMSTSTEIEVKKNALCELNIKQKVQLVCENKFKNGCRNASADAGASSPWRVLQKYSKN